MNGRLLMVAILIALAATGLSTYVAAHQTIPADVAVERDIQAIDWGLLATTFPFFSWVGGAPGFVFEVILCVAILLFNRRAWILGVGAVLSGGWYEVVSHLIHRPRPTTHEVLRVTENPGGASSYPSGHTIFIVTVTVVLLLSFGYRFLPRAARPVGWLVVILIIAANAIARIYTGAHWPTDVLGGVLIAAAWVAFLASFSWVSDRVLGIRTPAARRTPVVESPPGA